MTDRAQPDVPQEPANSAQLAAPQDAETRSNPEISEPMLDVHAPHQSVHTVKDFLIHIAAITIGLQAQQALERLRPSPTIADSIGFTSTWAFSMRRLRSDCDAS
jgi:hypothetical protein